MYDQYGKLKFEVQKGWRYGHPLFILSRFTKLKR